MAKTPKPDLDDGWFKYAYEMDAAFSGARLPHNAKEALRLLRFQLFGKAKRRIFVMSPKAMAEQTGIARPHCCRALQTLVDSGILRRVRPMVFRFNKYYDTWTKDGSPMFSAAEVARIARSSDYAISLAREDVSYLESLPEDEDAAGEADPIVDGGIIDSECEGRCAGAQRPVIPIAPAVALQRTERCPTAQQPTPPHPIKGELETTATPAHAHDPQSIAPEPVVDAAALFALAKVIDPMGTLASNVSAWSLSYPLDHIEGAIQMARAAGIRPMGQSRYITAILVSAKQRGHLVRPEEPAAPGAAPPVRLSPSQAKAERHRLALRELKDKARQEEAREAAREG